MSDVEITPPRLVGLADFLRSTTIEMGGEIFEPIYKVEEGPTVMTTRVLARVYITPDTMQQYVTAGGTVETLHRALFNRLNAALPNHANPFAEKAERNPVPFGLHVCIEDEEGNGWALSCGCSSYCRGHTDSGPAALPEGCAGHRIQALGSWEVYRTTIGYPFHCKVHNCNAWECFSDKPEPVATCQRCLTEVPSEDMFEVEGELYHRHGGICSYLEKQQRDLKSEPSGLTESGGE